jgi:pimeloyl-ACP methyl ester carboxylesterase
MRLHEYPMLFPLMLYYRKGHIKMTQTSDSTERSTSTSSRPRRTIKQRLLRLLVIGSLSLAGLLLLGLSYQAIASAVDATHSPAQGKLVDIGGYRLHINCTGTGSPTVILDAGLGGTSLDWSKVQPAVAHFTRVCSYDRAGYGWSESGPGPRTSQQIVTELHLLLGHAKIDGPYLLVGHSVGGLNMRLYAYRYPGDVAGMVLLDATSEHQFAPFGTHPAFFPPQAVSAGVQQLQVYRVAAYFGVTRLALQTGLAPLEDAAAYPAAIKPILQAQAAQTRYYSTQYDELAALQESAAQVRAARLASLSYGKLPLIVLSQDYSQDRSAQGKQMAATWDALQQDLASLSSNGQHSVAQHSGHYIQLDRPDLAIAAIQSVWQQARSSGH